MTDLDDRAKRAAKIITNPHLYKICEGCESIVVLQANHCPNCHGYRFDDDPERISEHAKLLGSRPQNSVKPGDLEG